MPRTIWLTRSEVAELATGWLAVGTELRAVAVNGQAIARQVPLMSRSKCIAIGVNMAACIGCRCLTVAVIVSASLGFIVASDLLCAVPVHNWKDEVRVGDTCAHACICSRAADVSVSRRPDS